jgi:hypothetical protein
VLIFAWIFGRRWDLVWQDNIIVPLLGIIAAPYTTIMYMLVWSPAGLHGFDWVWLFLGVMLDIMKWSQIVRNREGIPGQQASTQPATQTAAATVSSASPPAQQATKEATAQSELDGLAKLRDEGVITEEEYQAKKKQLLDQ